MSKRNTSGVWNFFTIQADSAHLATCDICSATMKRGKAGGNKKSFQVTSLWDHLKAKHPGEHKKAVGLRDDQAEKRRKVESDRVKQQEVYLLQAKKQTTLEDAMSPELKWPVESVKQKDLERLLTYWLCDSMQPYTTVENSLFKNFVTGLNKRFTIPSEKYLRTSVLPSLYNKVQYAVKCKLRELLKDTYFSITCDVWSSLALDSYLGVTLHFITKDFERKMVVLRCLPYNASHTGDSIKGRLQFILSSWGLQEMRLHATVSDTAANMRKALEDWAWIACFLHVLNLVVKHSIFQQSGVVRLIKKVISLIKKFRTPAGKRVLNTNQLEEGSLIRPVETRWNSYYMMLHSIKKHKAALTVSQQDTELAMTAQQQISPSDWELTDKVILILKPLLLATKNCEGDNVSVSEVIPWIKRLTHEVTQVTATGIGTLKSCVLSEMEKYFVTKHDMERSKEYCIATVLDPRFKLAGFSKRENSVYAKELTRAEMLVMMGPQPDTGNQSSPPEATDAASSSSSSWNAILTQSEQTAESQDEEETIAEELNRYLREKLLSIETGGDKEVLLYWKRNSSTFPHLAKLARRYLCSPPGSAASERLFSKAKNVLKLTRLSMKPANMEMNLFLKLALRSFDHQLDLCDAPESFIAPNSSILPNANVSAEDQISQSDCSDIEISSDEDDD